MVHNDAVTWDMEGIRESMFALIWIPAVGAYEG